MTRFPALLPASRAERRAARLAVRAVLWGIAVILAVTPAWIIRVVAMSGRGLTLALCALALAAPWPLFHIAVSRRSRSSRTGRAEGAPETPVQG